MILESRSNCLVTSSREEQKSKLFRRSPKELEVLNVRFPTNPIMPTIAEVIEVFKSQRSKNTEAPVEVKDYFGHWKVQPDEKVVDGIDEHLRGLAKIDRTVAAVVPGIDVVVFNSVSDRSSWRISVQAKVSEGFGAGTATYDERSRTWSTTQDPMHNLYVSSFIIRQRGGFSRL